MTDELESRARRRVREVLVRQQAEASLTSIPPDSEKVHAVIDVIVLRPATSAAAWRRCAAAIRRWFAAWPPQIDVQFGLDEPGTIALAEALGEAAADAWLAGTLDLGAAS